MNKYIFLGLCFLMNHLMVGGQVKLENAYQEIDKLFERYDKIDSPGYSMGVIQDGVLVYSKGYGMANLEYNIPLSDSSAFYIGSMAKQFTTAALLILEAEGNIDLNKPIRYYLPEFPAYDKEITVSHLIHHTSGIRETNSLQLFQGISRTFEEEFDTKDLYDLILAQKELNFLPGEEFRYSSGGYAVLAVLVERISKMSFREYLDKNIFDPLGMTSTFVCDNHNEVVKNRAVSYWPIGNDKYERRNQVFNAYGDGGIITTVEDLVKWDAAFYNDLLGVENFAAKMYQKGKLNNEEDIEYARALQIRDYKGLKMITHNGGMLGFRVDMVRFPELKTTCILLGNSAYLDPTGDILRMAEVLFKSDLKEESEQKESIDKSSSIHLKPKALEEFAGYYWTDDTNYYRRITSRSDSLFIDSGNINYAQYLNPIGDNEFEIKDFYLKNTLRFQPDIKGEELKATFGSSKRNFRKFNPQAPADLDEVKSYVGDYYSEELSTTYSVYLQSESLYLKINNNHPIQLFPAKNGIVWNGKEMVWVGFGEIKFTREINNTVSGLIMGDGRVSGVTFNKIR